MERSGVNKKGTSPSDSNHMMKPCIDSEHYLYKLPIASTKALALFIVPNFTGIF